MANIQSILGLLGGGGALGGGLSKELGSGAIGPLLGILPLLLQGLGGGAEEQGTSNIPPEVLRAFAGGGAGLGVGFGGGVGSGVGGGLLAGLGGGGQQAGGGLGLLNLLSLGR